MMRILLTNDDGIDAPGLAVLAEALRPHAELMIVAPATEQSAVGHAITIHDPLKVRERYHGSELFGYAVHGTPADCVKLALCSLMPQHPDLIMSGINNGANLSTDIIYSGTVSAATEGTLLGIPSLAVSINSFDRRAQFATAARAALQLLGVVPHLQLPTGTLLNVNVPDLPWAQLKGWKLTVQGRTKYVENYERRVDPRGNAYFWIAGTIVETDENPDADYRAVKNGFISLTPLHFDVTNHAYFAGSRARLEAALNQPDGLPRG
jgi:5'-nucleotidase